jgi:hypothetical protein
MTQLTEQLFSTIVHDFHNGGVKSSYGLDTYTRKEILTYLIRSKGCECIECLWGISHDTPHRLPPICPRYTLQLQHNELTKEEKNVRILIRE